MEQKYELGQDAFLFHQTLGDHGKLGREIIPITIVAVEIDYGDSLKYKGRTPDGQTYTCWASHMFASRAAAEVRLIKEQRISLEGQLSSARYEAEKLEKQLAEFNQKHPETDHAS